MDRALYTFLDQRRWPRAAAISSQRRAHAPADS
jgi:hypothetical protein